MRIEELPAVPGGGQGGEDGDDELLLPRPDDGDAAEGESGVVMRVAVDAKRAAVGVDARMLFYPTLVYNVVRNRFEEHFHWWDLIDEHVLLGAVPFPSDVLRLKALVVCGMVTLNESYERLVPTSLYEAHGIENLVLPTRDYLYAPSFVNLCEAADFIHSNNFLRTSSLLESENPNPNWAGDISTIFKREFLRVSSPPSSARE